MTRSIRVFALVIISVVACSACLTACAPASNAVPASTPEPTPASTPTAVSTAMPSATPSPEPTPKLSKEEAMRKLNITSNQIYCLADPIVFECTLKTGEMKDLVVYTTFRTGQTEEDGIVHYEMLNVTDNEVFATFSTDEHGWNFFDMMDRFQIDLIPEFLQGATINTTYQLRSIPWLFYGEPNDPPMPESKWLDYIVELQNTDPYQFLERRYTSLDCAEIILDIIPLENMVWASDYIDGFAEATPTAK